VRQRSRTLSEKIPGSGLRWANDPWPLRSSDLGDARSVCHTPSTTGPRQILRLTPMRHMAPARAALPMSTNDVPPWKRAWRERIILAGAPLHRVCLDSKHAQISARLASGLYHLVASCLFLSRKTTDVPPMYHLVCTRSPSHAMARCLLTPRGGVEWTGGLGVPDIALQRRICPFEHEVSRYGRTVN
jgi:hypothetical protein